MIMKLICNDIEEVTQVSGYHKEMDELYIEIYSNDNEVITVDENEIADPSYSMDLIYADVADSDEIYVAIYTDAMIELFKIYEHKKQESSEYISSPIGGLTKL